MNSTHAVTAALIALSITFGALIWAWYDPVWVAVMASSGVVFGALSLLVYSRRLMFMAAASPHSAFLAAALSIPLAMATGSSTTVWMVFIGLALVYTVGYLTYKGMDPDEATSLFVGLTASGGVLASYYVLARYPSSPQVIAVVFGDPLLSSRQDALLLSLVAVVLLAHSYLAAREIVYIGADPEDAALSGLKLWVYDLSLYTAIGIAVIAMVRAVGFILEHVLILLPALIAHYSARGVYQALTLSVAVALFASMLGLTLAVGFGQSPSAMTGALLVAGFIAVYSARWGK